MNPERWERVRGVLEDALSGPSDRRLRFVDAACGSDEELRREVRSLIAAHEEAGSLLESPATAPDGPSAVPDRIGNYRLLGEIGCGGMGAVYLAERADGAFHKQYALKLIPLGLASEEFVRRFREERQILAALDHPAIARLIDGGAAADGRPYLVMEYIRGEPIDVYCESHRLDLRQRLGLFVKVCEAVSFAHRNLVVHRDLKPGNILVTGDGEPKLLDFGIAKLLAEEAEAPAQRLTVPGRAPLTPEYASPEQVLEEPVSTASDVYSLGVLLFELLTGERPYAVEQRSRGQVARLLATVEPERPSRVLARQGRSAATRRSWLRRLAARRHRLPQDLDHIVLKALHRQPERRYAGAEQLGEDLRRHLAGQPVVARPDSVGYRTARFVLRHKLGVAVAAAALLALVAALILLATQRAQVMAERRHAEEVSRFLVDLFAVSDPARSRGATVTAREVLDLGARRIAHELSGQPLLRSDLEATLADVYAKLGLAEPALEHFQRVLATLRQTAPEDGRRIALALHGLGRASALKGDREAARRSFEEALVLQRRLADRHPAELAAALADLGYLLTMQAAHAEAEPILAEAVERAEKLGVEGRQTAASAWRAMGTLRREQGSYKASQQAYENALRLLSDRGPHPETADLLTDLGNLLSRRNELAGAESMLREALGMHRTLYPPEHPGLPVPLSNLALVLRAQGRYREAEALQREALAIATKAFAEDSPELGLHLHNLAAVLSAQGDLEAAEALYLRALVLTRRVSPGHPAVGIALNNLGSIYQQREDHPKAASYFRQAITSLEASFGPVHPEVLSPVRNLGTSLLAMGQPAEAEPLLTRALEIARQAVGENHPFTGMALLSLARLELYRGEREAAASLLDRAQGVLAASAGGGRRHLAETLEALAGLALERGEPEPAGDQAREAVAIYTQLYPEGHLRLRRAQLLLARCLEGARRGGEALSVLEQACSSTELPAWAADVASGCAELRQRLAGSQGAPPAPGGP